MMKMQSRMMIVVLTICYCQINTSSGADLLAINWNGDVYRIDTDTGGGVALNHSGFSQLNALARDESGSFYTASGNYTVDSRIIQISPETGLGTNLFTLNIRSITSMAFSPNGTLYAISRDRPSETSSLYTVDTDVQQATLIGSLGPLWVNGLAFSPEGDLYGWEVSQVDPTNNNGYGLVTLDTETGQVTDVAPLVHGPVQIQGLAFGPDGTLYGARDDLYTVDTTTGIASLVGTGGYTDVRGIEYVPEPSTLSLLALAPLAVLRRRRREFK